MPSNPYFGFGARRSVTANIIRRRGSVRSCSELQVGQGQQSAFNSDLMGFIVIQWDIRGIYPLVICCIAIENGPVEIVSFPIKNGGSFHSFFVCLQEGIYPRFSRVIPILHWLNPHVHLVGGIPTPLKNDGVSSSVGMIIYSIPNMMGKSFKIPFMFQSPPIGHCCSWSSF